MSQDDPLAEQPRADPLEPATPAQAPAPTPAMSLAQSPGPSIGEALTETAAGEDPAETAAEAAPGEDPAEPAAESTSQPPTEVTAPSRGRRAVRWLRGDLAPVSPRERARHRAIRRGVIATAALVVAGSWVQLPLLAMSPGPTFNTLGEIGGTPMITITGTQTFATKGSLDMTTVSERGGASGGVFLGEAIASWLAPHTSLIPREVYYDPHVTGDEVTERNDQSFATSQSDAIGAAMDELGIATVDSVVVTLVGGGTPADGIVAAGDIIERVDGQAVTKPADVVARVQATYVGATVVLEVLRADAQGMRTAKRLEVVAEANPSTDPALAGKPFLGIAVGTLHEAPFDIEFALNGVGGPSAGMMFSMAIVDKLTEGAMTGGGHVAGTGTIAADGRVGPIGGIDKKMLGARSAGATLFLAPATNCSEVVGHIPGGISVVPVTTLDSAVHVVETWAGDHAASFPTCQQALDSAAHANPTASASPAP